MSIGASGPRRSVLGSRILDCNCFAIWSALYFRRPLVDKPEAMSTSRRVRRGRRRGGADSRFSCLVVVVLGGTPVAFSDPSGRIYCILSPLRRRLGTRNRNHLRTING